MDKIEIMLITSNDIYDSGLSVSTEIPEASVERAIKTAEQYMVRPRLTNAIYIEFANGEHTDLFNGGIVNETEYITGLKEAIIELTFAVLLHQSINATTFGSVVKTDDYSKYAGYDDIAEEAKRHIEIGLAYLKEITNILGIKEEDQILNNFSNEEFI